MKKIVFCLIMFLCSNFLVVQATAAAVDKQGKDVPANTNLSPAMEQMATHLEFLGYRIEKPKTLEKGDKPLFWAYHNVNNNILVYENYPDFVYLITTLIAKKPLTSDMAVFANKATTSFDISNFHCGTDSATKMADIRFVAIYTGKYSKELFGQFLDFFRKDQDKIRYMENYEKIFLDN